MLARTEERIPHIPPDAVLRSGTVEVLVVDDDESLRHLLDRHLWHAGYDVRLAANVDTACGMIVENSPDIMIVDLEMRGSDPLDFVAAIRDDETIPFFPVIFLTARTDAASRARELGAICLLKPVRADKLLTTVALSTLIQRPLPRHAEPDPSLTAANEALFRFRLASQAHDL